MTKYVELIPERLNRWNNELLQGRLIIKSFNGAEKYVNVGADKVMKWSTY